MPTPARKPGRRATARPRRVAAATALYGARAPDLAELDAARAQRLIDVLGNNRLAELLGVSKSQPARWAARRDRVSAENSRKLIDLDYVMSRLLQLWHPSVIPLWLEGNNAHLRARPIDVVRLRGPAALIPALDAAEAGAME